MQPVPVIFLAFANDRVDSARYLRNLPQELRQLQEALEPAVVAGLCEVVTLTNATVSQVIDTFQKQRFKDRIAIFHYGGHADGYQLLLESESGEHQIAHGKGLVSFLSKQKSLQLAFLNGCSTQQQAKELIQAGLPVVIGTSSSIADDVATRLATRFYKGLANGLDLEQAWEESKDEVSILGKESNNRDFVSPDFERPDFGYQSWRMFIRKGAEIVKKWNFPSASQNPLFGLPNLPDTYDFPVKPFRFLERYHKSDANSFFGRGTYIRDFYHRINDQHSAPVLLLYGQSGVGKSSLLEAGLLPRLEGEWEIEFFRRDPDKGVSRQLESVFGTSPSPEDIRLAWKEREANNGKKGLLIIIDQVEEVFTRPRIEEPDELPSFLQRISQLLNNQKDRPQGKLVLIYRKEYDPEIEKACQEAFVPKEKIFLDRLGRKGIIEVVMGLTSTQRHKDVYRLSIEESLPTIIADDLLVDQDSPISPILQIILTRMWQEEVSKDLKNWGVESYNQLRAKGIFLDDFFNQQMSEIRAWENQLQLHAESSGLALDILNYHTTKLITAESRSLEEIRGHYQHQSEILDRLLQQFQRLYLLTQIPGQQTALAHDTLAPIVKKEINDSNRPGQRALRILMAKMPDFELNSERTYIDEEDLMLVEQGKSGMRMWTKKEESLVEKSKKRRERLQRERRRNQRLIRIATVLVGVFALIASGLGIKAFQESQKNQRKAEVNRLVSQALQAEKYDPKQAWNTVNEALSQLPDDQNTLQVRHQIFTNNEFYQNQYSHDTIVSGVSLSPDETNLATASGKTVRIWDKNKVATSIRSLLHPQIVNDLAYSPDGSLLVTACRDRQVRLWDAKGNVTRIMEGHNDWVMACTFSPDGEYLLTGSRDGELILWGKDGSLIIRQKAHKEAIFTLGFSSTGDTLMSGGTEGIVFLWEKTKTTLKQLNAYPHNARIYSASLDPRGKHLVTGTHDGIMRIWNLNGEIQQELFRHELRVNKICHSPDGTYILSGSNDHKIHLWNRSGRWLKTYKGHNDWVTGVSFSKDGRYFVSSSTDSTVKYWKLISKEAMKWDHEGAVVSSVAFLPGGKILTGIGDPYMEVDVQDPNISPEELYRLTNEKPAKPVFVWDSLGKKTQSFEGHEGTITSVAAEPQNGQILSASDDGSILLWDQSGKIIQNFGGHKDAVNAIGFSSIGDFIASVSSDSSGMIWNIDGSLKATLPHPRLTASLAFSPTEPILLTGCYDGIARIWSMEGELIDSFITEKSRIEGVTFSPDGKSIAIGTSGRTAALYVWDRAHNLILHYPIQTQNATNARSVNAVHFSPDGKYILIGLDGGVAQVLTLEGQEIQTLNEFGKSNVYSVAFSPDGKKILTGSGDGWARMFDRILE